jgi:mRNA-degrading endonuclease RelE of RelBE toxin-antitoxin system
MKKTNVFYTEAVVSYLRHLSPQNKPYLKSFIEELGENPLAGRPLQRELSGYHVLRYKKYRIIYEYHHNLNTVDIVFAGLRKDVYQLFAEILRRRKKD